MEDALKTKSKTPLTDAVEQSADWEAGETDGMRDLCRDLEVRLSEALADIGYFRAMACIPGGDKMTNVEVAEAWMNREIKLSLPQDERMLVDGALKT